MASIHERFNPWLTKYLEPRYPELVSPLRAALDAYDRIERKQHIAPDDIAPILDIARSHRRPLYENAADLLSSLTADYPTACEAVAEMARDKQAHVRFNAIICLGLNTPREFCINLIRQSLTDKSSRIRQKAADWTLRLGLSELVPDLERASANESHASTKQILGFYTQLMRDGYILETKADNSLSITVPTQGGGIRGRSVSREEFETKGLDALVEALKAGHD